MNEIQNGSEWPFCLYIIASGLNNPNSVPWPIRRDLLRMNTSLQFTILHFNDWEVDCHDFVILIFKDSVQVHILVLHFIMLFWTGRYYNNCTLSHLVHEYKKWNIEQVQVYLRILTMHEYPFWVLFCVNNGLQFALMIINCLEN